MGERTDLRAVLERDGCTVLPGVYDGISARIADRMGFAGLYMTGYGVVASATRPQRNYTAYRYNKQRWPPRSAQ